VPFERFKIEKLSTCRCHQSSPGPLCSPAAAACAPHQERERFALPVAPELAPGANVIELFSSSLTLPLNKLECLSMASFFSGLLNALEQGKHTLLAKLAGMESA
jgi:hypothetical protein